MLKKLLVDNRPYWLMAIYICILAISAFPYAIAPLFVMTYPNLRWSFIKYVARAWLILMVIAVTAYRIQQLIALF